MFITQLIRLWSENSYKTAIILILVGALIYFVALATSRFVIRVSPNYSKERKRNKIYQGVAAFCTAAIILWFGVLSMETYKALAFFLLLFYASICDIEERSVSNFVSVQLLILGLVNVDIQTLVKNVLAGGAIFAFMFVAGMIANGKLGGADVKIVGACAFVLGLQASIAGLIAGLLAAVIITKIIMRKKESDEQRLPLVPYLSAGFFISYMVTNILL